MKPEPVYTVKLGLTTRRYVDLVAEEKELEELINQLLEEEYKEAESALETARARKHLLEEYENEFARLRAEWLRNHETEINKRVVAWASVQMKPGNIPRLRERWLREHKTEINEIVKRALASNGVSVPRTTDSFETIRNIVQKMRELQLV